MTFRILQQKEKIFVIICWTQPKGRAIRYIFFTLLRQAQHDNKKG